MCGICGEINFNGAGAEIGKVSAMTDRLVRRGPDAGGLSARDGICFGHRRLKIIDLSERSGQPFVDTDLGLTVVYNGAIYNFRELRTELEAKGYRFVSRGDTEVIAKGYHAWGIGVLDRLAGMFAFAIHEWRTDRVFAARDRLGIKPFYYAHSGGTLRFASTLQALLAGGGIDTSIDPVALHHYMTFHSVVPAPHTILKGVRKLPPATCMTVEPNGNVTQETYWRLGFDRTAEDETRSEEEWVDLLLDSLRLSVRRRLVADVPVGVLLSGGVDSSLVVGLLAEQGKRDIRTFSIGFESVNGEEGNEFRYSDIIASAFATHHRKFNIDSRSTFRHMPECVAAMSEPMVSHDVIGFYLISREVSKDVKVVLSGQGADEVFGGYHWYPPMIDAADHAAKYAEVFFDRDHAEYARAVRSDLVSKDYSRAFVEEFFANGAPPNGADKALMLDTTVMLVDDPVKRVDNTTMSWGLEARVPFLDHDLVELAARIPARLKVREGGKYILKEASRRVIPHEVIDRPKGYFPVPALKYLKGEALAFVNEIVTSSSFTKRNLFNPDYVATLMKEPEAHITPLRGNKLWQVALLEYWFQKNGIAP